MQPEPAPGAPWLHHRDQTATFRLAVAVARRGRARPRDVAAAAGVTPSRAAQLLRAAARGRIYAVRRLGGGWYGADNSTTAHAGADSLGTP